MKKVLIAQFTHETNTFCAKKADFEAFRVFRWFEGEDLITKQRGVATDLGGFVDEMEKYGDTELIPAIGIGAMPCGTVQTEVFDFACERILGAIKAHMPLDGVFFHLHGATVVEGHPDASGELCAATREIIGENIPLICSLDLHANVTKKMAENADALVCYDCYPHTDIAETGAAAARIMRKILREKAIPTMAYRRIPYLLPLFPTAEPQISPIYDRMKEMRGMAGVLEARLAHGFFPSDVEEMGMAVMVTTDNDQALAERLAEELSQMVIERIPQLVREYPDLDEVLDRIEREGKYPAVLADASDNPGAGALGETTHILRRILERGITGAAVATILDPESVKKCEQAGVGNTVHLSLGGWSDPVLSGGPIEVEAYVRAITDGNYVFKGKMSHGLWGTHGKAAVIEVGGNVIIVTSLTRQPFDLEVFRSHGIAPEEYRILVTKSSVHYKADYGKIAKAMYTLSLPGVASPDPKAYRYKNWKGNV